ncbi:MAG: phosphatidylglycerophosphatase A [Candidatus Komeilibacteria bacterium]
MIKLARQWCTLFGLGHLPGRGTLASALIFIVAYFVLGINTLVGQILLAAMVLISVLLTYSAAKLYTQTDPLEIISDEVAASALLALIIPYSWLWFLIAFVLFRFFDISKILGIKQLETLPGATGILTDDFGAVLYSYIIIIITHIWL